MNIQEMSYTNLMKLGYEVNIEMIKRAWWFILIVIILAIVKFILDCKKGK